MWKRRLSGIYPREWKGPFLWFCWFKPCLAITPPSTHQTKSFWHLHVVHSGQALFALVRKADGVLPREPSGTSAGLCRGRKGNGGAGSPLQFGPKAESSSPPQPPHSLSHPHNMVIVQQWITRPLRRCGLLLGLWLWTRFLSSVWMKSNPCKYGTCR